MATTLSNDIRVSVETSFDNRRSDPAAGRFLYAYRIHIHNGSMIPVRLMSRRWVIIDSLAAPRVVEGPGVVGETPVIAPGETFSYSSGCDLRSGAGSMAGTYLMMNISDARTFTVRIPSFDLLYPWSAN